MNNSIFIEGGDVFGIGGSVNTNGAATGFGGLAVGAAWGFQRCVVSTICLN